MTEASQQKVDVSEVIKKTVAGLASHHRIETQRDAAEARVYTVEDFLAMGFTPSDASEMMTLQEAYRTAKIRMGVDTHVYRK